MYNDNESRITIPRFDKLTSFSPANLNNLLEGEELGPSCGDKWDAKRDKGWTR